MRQLFTTYRAGSPILRQLVAELPWGHNLLILHKTQSEEERRFYMESAAKLGWSRAVLLNQIKADAWGRRGLEPLHNFAATLPEHLLEQADEAMKSSYCLDFLGLAAPLKERALEQQLLVRLKDFLLELGYGFCFVGSQHRLILGRKEYFIDLLFYHRFLKCLVAIELKTVPFEPEFAGKMDFYLNLLNAREKAPDDNPSIGIILCAERDTLEVEFSLSTKQNPIGVAEYELRKSLPREYKGKLPSAKQWSGLLGKITSAAKPGT
jgi:predicted nuclease of restriction endonuclease-like (RecB) superfamily